VVVLLEKRDLRFSLGISEEQLRRVGGAFELLRKKMNRANLCMGETTLYLI